MADETLGTPMTAAVRHVMCLLVVGCVLACGCNGDARSGRRNAGPDDPGSGLRAERDARGMRTSVTYLPASYLARNERPTGSDGAASDGAASDGAASDGAAPDPDSTRASYEGGLVFRLDIERLDGSGLDAQDMAARVQALTYTIAERVELRCGDSTVAPALATVENAGATGERVRALVVFDRNRIAGLWRRTPVFEIIFRDDVFDTGINSFRFDAAAVGAAG